MSSNLYTAVMDALQARDDIERRIEDTRDTMATVDYEDELKQAIKQMLKEVTQ